MSSTCIRVLGLSNKWSESFSPLGSPSLLSQTTSRSSSGETRGRRTASSRRRTCTGRSPSSSRLRRISTRTSQTRWRSACRCAASPTRWRASPSASPTCPTTRVSGKGRGSTSAHSRLHFIEGQSGLLRSNLSFLHVRSLSGEAQEEV